MMAALHCLLGPESQSCRLVSEGQELFHMSDGDVNL